MSDNIAQTLEVEVTAVDVVVMYIFKAVVKVCQEEVKHTTSALLYD
jgi:hypothetical protein